MLRPPTLLTYSVVLTRLCNQLLGRRESTRAKDRRARVASGRTSLRRHSLAKRPLSDRLTFARSYYTHACACVRATIVPAYSMSCVAAYAAAHSIAPQRFPVQTCSRLNPAKTSSEARRRLTSVETRPRLTAPGFRGRSIAVGGAEWLR